MWSRRRAAVAEEARALEAEAAAEVSAAQEAALAERSDEEILQELDLPEPETLDSAEAVREFLASAVPQRLKTRALRRLWTLNPVLANLDGLVDYGQDFTDSATVVENLQTAYQVGKGMLKHIEALAEQAAAKDAPELEDEIADLPEEAEEAPEVLEAAPLPTAAPDEAPVAALTDPEEPAAVSYTPRRMQFRFEESA